MPIDKDRIFLDTCFWMKAEHLRYISTVEPRFKVPRYNGNLDIKVVFVSTEDWWTNFTA